jgi:hypothetical protein
LASRSSTFRATELASSWERSAAFRRSCNGIVIGSVKVSPTKLRNGSAAPSARISTGRRESAVVYWLDARDPGASLVLLSYDLTVAGQERPQPVECLVPLTTTVPHFGGLRWWFRCPLAVNGHPCNRRVGKLYLPPGRRYFGCRRCHDLTDTARQTHDRRVDLLRKDPEALRRPAEELENASPDRLILLRKALPP